MIKGHQMALARKHPGFISKARLRGLTLQEMLIVIAVFAVLAVIFVMSSRQVMVKARYSRVTQEQKILSDALDEYQTQRSTLPSNEEGLISLIRQTSLNQIPNDPFSKQSRDAYEYHRFEVERQGEKYWVVVSAGPDGDIDFAPIGSEMFSTSSESSGPTSSQSAAPPWTINYSATPAQVRALIARTQYDPTNGITSNGDIIRVSR